MLTKKLLACGVFVFSLLQLQAGKPDLLVPVASPPIKSEPTEAWQFAITPYAWLAGADGTIGREGTVIDLPFKVNDLVDDSSAIGAMLALEARKGRWGIHLDSVWVNVDVSASTSGAFLGGLDVDMDIFRISPMLSYALTEGDTRVDLLAGLQYFDADVELGFDVGAPSDFDTDFVDPMIGLSVHHRISDRWSIFARGDIGGFDVGSELTWQIFGAIGYRIGTDDTLFAGYRHLDLDYQSGDTSLTFATSGFFLGYRLQF